MHTDAEQVEQLYCPLLITQSMASFTTLSIATNSSAVLVEECLPAEVPAFTGHSGFNRFFLGGAQVVAGLKKIAQLDMLVKEKLLENVMVERETFPEKWAQKEQDRLDRRARQVDNLLAKERKAHTRR